MFGHPGWWVISAINGTRIPAARLWLAGNEGIKKGNDHNGYNGL